MARPGIDYADVVDAIQYLTKNNINPTLQNVRQYLGTGSNTTLTKHIKQYKAEHDLPATLRAGLSPEVVAIARQLQNQINKLAIKEINAYKFENSMLDKQLKAAKAEIRRLKKRK